MHSLSTLLNKQHGYTIVHEPKPNLPWLVDKKRLNTLIDELKLSENEVVGGVAFYFLNYVGLILQRFPTAKFICLYRSKEQTIESFNHQWKHLDGNVNRFREKNGLFPYYGCAIDRRSGLGQFWDEYYNIVDYLHNMYPCNIIYMNYKEALATHSGQTYIFNFLEIPKHDRIVDTTI